MEEKVNSSSGDLFMFNPNDTAREIPYYVGIDPVSLLRFTWRVSRPLNIVFKVRIYSGATQKKIIGQHFV